MGESKTRQVHWAKFGLSIETYLGHVIGKLRVVSESYSRPEKGLFWPFFEKVGENFKFSQKNHQLPLFDDNSMWQYKEIESDL